MHAPPTPGFSLPSARPPFRPGGDRLWLIAGTGEGPALARRLLVRGWRLRVSVVTASARLAYPNDPRLEVVVGALAGASAWQAALAEAERQGDPFQWLVDASHPFASLVTAAAAAAMEGRPERLVRLHRPPLPTPLATPLSHIRQMEEHLRRGDRLLLAIGARQLREALRHCGEALPHCRVLPHPQALRLALQAGVPPQRIACLHPTEDGAMERGLCEHWGITTILCRQSGGTTEALWWRISEERGLRLLSLRRPPEPSGLVRLPLEELIEHLGWPQR
jgi:precorrin-6A/cobalt-precorrin-6A reductase